MMLSVVGTGLLFITQSNDDKKPEELAQQDKPEDAEDRTCPQLQTPPGAKSLPLPDIKLPEGDVTELATEDLKEGKGDAVKAGAVIEVHYHGVRAVDGCVFDSSYARGEPAELGLGQVIQGWQEGIVGMKAGGVRILTIPSDQAYGAQGAGEVIGPNEDLVFQVELVEIVE